MVQPSPWRAAALPLLAVLGVMLPLIYVPQLDDFLFYLRPADLLPAYGTAWLFLALPCFGLWLIAALLLGGLRRRAGTQWGARVLARLLSALAAAIIVASLLYCLLVWLQSFDWLRGLSYRNRLFWPAMLVGAVLGYTAAGQRLLERCRPVIVTAVVLGALTMLTLPFESWHPQAPPPAAALGAEPARPNIVILSMDALSAEHMSLYGAARPTTPQLTEFAEHATTFDQAYANGNFTTPGVASILTGTRPWTNRALQLASWPDQPTREESLPALLYRSGYQTGYVSTNSAAGAARNGFARYFDFASRDRVREVDLCTDGLSELFRYACPVAAMPLFGELVSLAASLHGGPDPRHYDPQLAIDPALAWLRRTDRSRPVFLWVHLFPPHSPYVAPPPWLGEFDSSGQARSIAATEPHWGWALSELSADRVELLSSRYDESVRYVDHYAGEFLERALQVLGPNTVVVVTADHGESFHHGYGAHTGPGLYNEIIRIPLIIKLPGQTQPIRCPWVVEQVDLAPTLAQLAGLPAELGWEGRSLLGVWAYPDPLPSRPAFSMNFEQNPRYAPLSTGSIAVIDGPWKLVRYMGHLHYPQMPPLHDTLYDLASDPEETQDLSASHPEQVQRLRTLIDAQLAGISHTRGMHRASD